MTLKRKFLRTSTVIGLVLGVLVSGLTVLGLVHAKQAAASISIAKSPESQTVAIHGTASFTIDVTNTGSESLTNVNVSDVLVPSCSGNLGTLGVGELRSYSCTLSNVTDGLVNSVTVTGAPSGGGVLTESAAAKVRLSETTSCPAGMGAYWRFDETSGTTFDDFYYGYDGICSGASCPMPATGVYMGGQDFDGITTGITVTAVPGDESLNWGLADSFSIELWLKTDSASTCAGNEVAIGRRDSAGEPGWWIGCWDGGQAAFFLEDSMGSADKVELVGTTDVADGEWHHIVAVRDGGAEINRLYVDGFEEHSKPAAYDNGFQSETAAITLGWLDVASRYRLDGVMDEVAIYGVALSPTDVQQHHSEGLAGRWYCQTGNYAPVIVSTAVTDATFGVPYEYDVNAAGSPVPTYSLSAHPSGMTIDTSTGLISWTPASGQVGSSHGVEVVTTNSRGTDTQSYEVVVAVGSVCAQGMTAYWKLDETSGLGPYDDSFDGHDSQCTSISSCPVPAAGRVGGGQKFSSATALTVPAHADFDWGTADSFSIEFWMRTGSASTCAGNQVIVGRRDPSELPVWWVGCVDGGQAAFFLRDSLDTDSTVTHSADVTDGAWHHVAATRDAESDSISIFVDGDAGISQNVIYTGSFGTSAPLSFGWLDVGSEYHFRGNADEIAVHERALPASEIQEHYSRGTSGKGYCTTPSIEIAKTPDDQTVPVGLDATFTIAVTNNGDAALTSVMVHDALTPDCARTIGSLSAGEQSSYTCAAHDVARDFVNSATVTGVIPSGPEVTDTDTASVSTVVLDFQFYLPVALKN